MLCALRMMRLSPLWRKISVRRTAATACERSTSRKKAPRPDARQLVGVANEYETAALRQRL